MHGSAMERFPGNRGSGGVRGETGKKRKTYAKPTTLEHCFGSPYPARTVLSYANRFGKQVEMSIDADTLEDATAEAQRIVSRLHQEKRLNSRRGSFMTVYANPPEVVERLCAENYNLAFMAARKFLEGNRERRRHLLRFGDTGDFYGQAYLAMHAAARTYQPQKGNAFSTHAVHSIKLALGAWVAVETKRCALGVPVYDSDGKPSTVHAFIDVNDQWNVPAKPEADPSEQDDREAKLKHARTASARLSATDRQIVVTALKLMTVDVSTLHRELKGKTTRNRQTFSTMLQTALKKLGEIVQKEQATKRNTT